MSDNRAALRGLHVVRHITAAAVVSVLAMILGGIACFVAVVAGTADPPALAMVFWLILGLMSGVFASFTMGLPLSIVLELLLSKRQPRAWQFVVPGIVSVVLFIMAIGYYGYLAMSLPYGTTLADAVPRPAGCEHAEKVLVVLLVSSAVLVYWTVACAGKWAIGRMSSHPPPARGNVDRTGS